MIAVAKCDLFKDIIVSERIRLYLSYFSFSIWLNGCLLDRLLFFFSHLKMTWVIQGSRGGEYTCEGMTEKSNSRWHFWRGKWIYYIRFYDSALLTPISNPHPKSNIHTSILFCIKNGRSHTCLLDMRLSVKGEAKKHRKVISDVTKNHFTVHGHVTVSQNAVNQWRTEYGNSRKQINKVIKTRQ